MSLRVYVAAPYSNAPTVRDVHERLAQYGLTPTSTWALDARGPENLYSLPIEVIRSYAHLNDKALESSHAVLVLAPDVGGAEMFCELRLAISKHIPVVYVGRRCLSAYRYGVTIAEDLDDAIVKLVAMARGAA